MGDTDWRTADRVVLVVALLSNDFKFSIPEYQWANIADLLSKVVSPRNLLLLAGIGLVFVLLSSAAIRASGGNIKKYCAGFGIIYVIAIFSLIIAGNKSVSYYGIEYVVFALLIGLLLRNLFSLPSWHWHLFLLD